MSISPSLPVYPISVAARLLEVHPRTLRIYEEEGLITPTRKGPKRYFSQDDINWLSCVRDLIHNEGISIPAIKKLLDLTPCWEIKECSREIREACSAFVDRTTPCWEQADTFCSQTRGHCESCDVFLTAMAGAQKGIHLFARR